MKANQKVMEIKSNKNAYAKIVGQLVALLITIIVGIMVFWSISGGITLTSDAANDSRNTTTTMASTVFGLLPIIALVVVGAILIGIVLRFGGGGKGL